MKKYSIIRIFQFVIFGFIVSCSQPDEPIEVKKDSILNFKSNLIPFKKGTSNTNLNHLQNLEAEMLEEVFCYAPRLGGGNFFFIPTSRGQNLFYGNIQPNDVVSGGGGGSPAQLEQFLVSGEIITITDTRVKDPCIKQALETILHSNKLPAALSYMLNKFKISNKINLDFREASYLPGDTLAMTTDRRDGNTIITFNLNRLKNVPQEIIYTTIFHEVIHANLYLKLEKNHHNEMAFYYRDLIVQLLVQQFPNIKFPDDLSWMGLENTEAFIGLREWQKKDYYKRRQTYINNQNGTKCN